MLMLVQPPRECKKGRVTSIALTGPSKSGKTSLLFQVRDNLFEITAFNAECLVRM